MLWGPATEEEFKYAKEFFVLPQKTRIIWNNGARITDIYRTVESFRTANRRAGQRKSAWLAYGYVLSQQEFHAIALHDCDILTYKGICSQGCAILL